MAPAVVTRPPGRGPWPLRREAALGLAAVALLALVARGALFEPCLVGGGGMAPTLLPGDVLVVSRTAYALRLPLTAVTLATLATPARGDVVVFPDPGDPARRLVKRVVGLPGETIELREQVLHVDGVPQPRLELGPFTYLEPGEGDRPPREDTCRRWREQLEAGPSRTAGAAVAGAAGEAPRAGGAGRAHEVLQCRRLRAGRSEGPFGPVRPGHLFVLGDNRDRSADGRAGWEVPVAEVVGRGALIGWSWGPGGWWPGGGAGVRIDRLFKPVE